MPGAATIIEDVAILAEEVAPGCERRLLAEATRAFPTLGKLISKGKTLLPPASRAGEAGSLHEVAKTAIQDFARTGDLLRREWQQIVTGSKNDVRGIPEIGSLNRSPRPLTPDEEDERLERLMRMMDDSKVGTAPIELTNQGLGARLWQFGSAGGNVMRERFVSETTGKWSPELLASRQWLQQNAANLERLPGLTQRFNGGTVQMVHQGESTQFAAAPLSVGLRTDNVATCAAIYCKSQGVQFLGHADGMIHHQALSEALHVAGINLNKAEVALMPGPVPSPVLETILPSFMKNAKVMKSLRIIPFKGPQHGTVIARDGSLFLP
jgi:hypothetical protein